MFTQDILAAIVDKIRLLTEKVSRLEELESTGDPRGTEKYLPKFKTGGIGLEDTSVSEGTGGLLVDEAIRLQNDKMVVFDGTAGGGSGGIEFVDSGSNDRYALFFPGSDIVALGNRAASGEVEIRADDSNGGSSGEKILATFRGNVTDDLNETDITGRINQQPYSTLSGGNCGVIRQQFMREFQDNTVQAIFKVLTNDGTADAGHYVCIVEVIGMNNSGTSGPSSASGSTATVHEQYKWVRSMGSAGSGVNSSLLAVHGTLLSAATAPATRDIATMTGSVYEVSEFDVRFRLTIDGSGTAPTPLYAFVNVTLIWAGFLVEPQLLAS